MARAQSVRDVFAYAAAQVKESDGSGRTNSGRGYTFWGGREGYMTLLNTE